MKQSLLAVFLFPLLASCELGAPGLVLPIPIPGEPPVFRESSLGFLEPGRTTKQEVRDTLFAELSLTPSQRRDESGNWWRYTATHQGWHDLLELGDATSVREFLLVEFDHEDIVRNYAVVDQYEPCDLSHGICFYGPHLMRVDDPESDRVAKQFRSDPDHCLLYIYSSDKIFTLWSPIENISWHLDGEQLIDLINADFYYRVDILPGRHSLSAYKYGRYGVPLDTASFECGAGELVFFRGSDVKGIWEDRYEFALERVTTNRGTLQVGVRFLALESFYFTHDRVWRPSVE